MLVMQCQTKRPLPLRACYGLVERCRPHSKAAMIGNWTRKSRRTDRRVQLYGMCGRRKVSVRKVFLEKLSYERLSFIPRVGGMVRERDLEGPGEQS